jgi:ABC-2 type transport system permease protein
MSALAAQARMELVLALRQGEQLLVALGIPALVLVFFSVVDVLPTGTDDPIDYLAPATLALAVMSSAMVGTGIGTGFERHYGVLKRLGVTPLGRPRLLGAKLAALGVSLVVQLTLLTALAVALGWRPDIAPLVLLAAVALGAAAFAGIGFLLAGVLSGPANLAVCNGLYVLLLLVGGVAVRATELPGPMRTVAGVLPSGALTEAMLAAVGGLDGGGIRPWSILVVWAVISCAAAARWFRWE